MDSGELFAECPLPDKPELFLSSVEPVTDSSRYFVLKVVDPKSKRHAFLGLGFRERTQSSDFNAAIDEHRQYLRRKKEADQHKKQFEDSEEANKDYSLKEGEKITIQIKKSPSAGGTAASSKFKSRLSVGGGTAPLAGGLLAPPPPAAAAKKPAAATSEAPATDDWADFESNVESAEPAPVVAAEVKGADGEGGFEDDWGDFTG